MREIYQSQATTKLRNSIMYLSLSTESLRNRRQRSCMWTLENANILHGIYNSLKTATDIWKECQSNTHRLQYLQLEYHNIKGAGEDLQQTSQPLLQKHHNMDGRDQHRKICLKSGMWGMYKKRRYSYVWKIICKDGKYEGCTSIMGMMFDRVGKMTGENVKMMMI